MYKVDVMLRAICGQRDVPSMTGGLSADSDGGDTGRVDDRYSLLASAIAGRRLRVRQNESRLPYTDGQVIYVPSQEHDRLIIGLVVQAAMLAAGSFESDVIRQLVARRSPTRRYLTLESARAVDYLGDLAPSMLREVLTSNWQGRLSEDATESLDRALNGERIPEAPEIFGTIHPRALLKGGGGDVGSPQEKDTRRTMVEPEVPELDDDEDSDWSKILAALSVPLTRQNWFFRQLRNMMGGRRSRPEGGGASDDMPVGAMVAQSGESSRHARIVTAPDGLTWQSPEAPDGSRRYPEWDVHKGIYRPNWCHVNEYDPPAGERDIELDGDDSGEVRRKLARIGLGYRRHDRQPEGDGFDVTALVEFAVSRAVGEPGDDRVYQARLRSARDLGVLVLLDGSGSCGEKQENGATVWDEQRRVAANLVRALEDLGERVGAYGFNSYGREHVRFLRIKDFDGRFDRSARNRLTALQPGAFTRLGAAVRHASHLVASTAGTSKQLLVLVSDGFAYDEGYEGRYAEEDTRRAVTEAVDNGIGCVCITVGSATGDKALDRVWGTSASHARLTEAARLRDFVAPCFRTALRVATHRS